VSAPLGVSTTRCQHRSVSAPIVVSTNWCQHHSQPAATKLAKEDCLKREALEVYSQKREVLGVRAGTRAVSPLALFPAPTPHRLPAPGGANPEIFFTPFHFLASTPEAQPTVRSSPMTTSNCSFLTHNMSNRSWVSASDQVRWTR
jgi:hypothetical protein